MIEKLISPLSLLNHLENVLLWVSSNDFKQQLFLSPAYEKIWQRPAKLLQTSPELFWQYIALEDQERIIKDKPQRQGIGTATWLFRINRPDGEQRWLKSSSQTLIDSAGKPGLIVGIDEILTPNQWVHALEHPNETQPWVDNFLDTINKTLQSEIKPANPPLQNTHELLVTQGKVTHRESECIAYLLKGYSAKQTAAVLQISVRTIEFYLNNLRRKFGCRSNTALISRLLTFADATTF